MKVLSSLRGLSFYRLNLFSCCLSIRSQILMNVPLDRTIALLPRPVSTSREASVASHLHVQTTTGECQTRKYDPLIFFTDHIYHADHMWARSVNLLAWLNPIQLTIVIRSFTLRNAGKI